MWIWIVLGILALLFIGVMLWLFWFTFLRHSQKHLNEPDGSHNAYLGKYAGQVAAGMKYIASQPCETVTAESFDGLRLSARWFPSAGSDRAILLFHGYRSSGDRDFSCAVQLYLEAGFNVLLVDQRSHGKSQGRIITFGVKERRDVMSWIQFVLRRFGGKMQLFLGGMSMGAATVLLSAGLELPDNVKGIVADCGFTSPVEIIRKVSFQAFHLYGYVTLPVMNFLCRIFGHFGLYGVSTEDALRHSSVPVLFIHGRQDNFVPCEMSERGYAAANGEKYIHLVDGADHGFSFLVDPDGVKAALLSFLEKYSRQEA